MQHHPEGSRRVWRKLGALSCAAALAVGLAACGSSASSESSSSPSSSSQDTSKRGVVPPPAGDAAMLELVPDEMKKAYEGVSTFAKVRPNPYLNWTPPKPPWKVCLAETYLKNTFRQQMLAEHKVIIAEWQKQGLVKGDLTVLNSNGDANLYISQINQLVSQGCDAIFSLPTAATGYCKAVDNAHAKGILFYSINAATDCKNAVTSGQNQYLVQLELAKWLAEKMGGKGNLLLMEGIAGSLINTARVNVVKAVFDTYPGIKVQDTVEGAWTATVAKTAVLKYLATHPGKIDAVYDSGAMATAAAQAFEQTGRPAPVQNNFAADCSWLAYWKEKGLDSATYAEGPRAAVAQAYALARRMLEGEKPAINTFLFPLPKIDKSNFDEWYKPSMTVDSTCFAEPKSGLPVEQDYWDALFKKAS